MKSCEQYDPAQLRQLLDETLPDATEQAMSDHVAACSICQQQLESLAAGQNWWAEASYRLSQSSAEVESLRMPRIDHGQTKSSVDVQEHQNGIVSNHKSFPLSHSLQNESFDEFDTSDFAVDFLEASDDAGVVGRLGDCDILEVIGRGGMGIVLKGFQKELNRYVAVKVLSPNLATSGAARRRFAREAQATAAIVNPHVMAIHSVHANARLPYLVMPFVACESLQQRLDRQGPLDLKDTLRIAIQAARGLAAAHAQGLVHRDIKPANILLETNVERVMLTDFGLARAVDDATLTRTGIIAGTPQYMSPEQANGDAIDHRSDLFSLGSVLYAMSTARPPFRAETTFGVLRRIRETEPRPVREINPDIPEWFESVINRLLSKSPQDRIATATETAELLEQCLAHVQQPMSVALPIKMSSSSSNRSGKHEALARQQRLSISIAALTIVGSLGLWAIWSNTNRGIIDRAVPPLDTGARSEQETPVEGELTDEELEWNRTADQLQLLHSSLQTLETNSGPGSEVQPE